MKELTIGRNDAGQRLDRFLAKAVPLLPASLAAYNIELVGASIENMDFTDAFTDAVEAKQVAEQNKLRAAQDKAAQTMQRAEAQVALEKKRAMNEIKDDVSDMAVDIASAVLQRDIRSEEHTELIDSFIEKLGDSHD